MTTTPMGTCCENGNFGEQHDCLKAPPTANMFQYRADPNEKKLDFTERTDEQNKAILDRARPLIEENRRLLGLDTPNTGTEWEREFDETIKNRMRSNNDALLRNEIPWIDDFIRRTLATQKSHLIAEVDEIQKACAEADGTVDGITALYTLKARLKGM